MAKLYRELGKRVFAICDNQDAANKALIEAEVELLLMHSENGFEDLVLKNTTDEALKRFAKVIEWPPHLAAKYPDVEASASAALSEYFGWTKANWGIADFLAQCSETEIPAWLREACIGVTDACTPATPVAAGKVPAELKAGADAAD